MDGFFRIFRSVGNAGDPVLIWISQALVVLKSDLMTRISGFIEAHKPSTGFTGISKRG